MYKADIQGVKWKSSYVLQENILSVDNQNVIRNAKQWNRKVETLICSIFV